MTSDDAIEQVFPSATFEWRPVKVGRPAGGHKTARRKPLGWRRLTRQPRSRPVRLTITYRGGAESWWWVEARGEKGALPGWMALEDVMSRILSEI